MAFNPVNAPFIVGTPLARYSAFAPMVTAPECVMRTPAFNVKSPFKIVAPEIVVAPVPANVAEAPIFVVSVEEKPYAAELLKVTSDATTTGPAKVMALVPVTVCGLVENVIVPVPGADIVPLLVKPPLNSSGAFIVFVNVPAFV